MDVDVFANAHSAQWQRLRELSAQRRLTGREADELVQLYRQGATHLSLLRSNAPDPALVSELSVILVKARARIASPHDLTWSTGVQFLTRTIPAALYRVRWWSLAVTAACLLVAAVAGVWLVAQPELLNELVPPEQQRQVAEQAFASYYSEYPSASFTALVWTNNAFIAALCVATGITGLFPAQVLFSNSLNVGVMGAVMHVQGADWVFWSLILPHGLLELSCVFVAGAAGIRLFWAWLVPGPRTRRRALAEEGRTTIVVVVALTIALGVSGFIEGFVTGSELNPWVKIGIGVLACAAFWLVTFVAGRRAVAAGVAPGLSAEEARNQVAVAA
nr:stage II sporulation protein M [Propionicimonas sp.]